MQCLADVHFAQVWHARQVDVLPNLKADMLIRERQVLKAGEI